MIKLQLKRKQALSCAFKRDIYGHIQIMTLAKLNLGRILYGSDAERQKYWYKYSLLSAFRSHWKQVAKTKAASFRSKRRQSITRHNRKMKPMHVPGIETTVNNDFFTQMNYDHAFFSFSLRRVLCSILAYGGLQKDIRSNLCCHEGWKSLKLLNYDESDPHQRWNTTGW